jgi:hypothetical protein
MPSVTLVEGRLSKGFVDVPRIKYASKPSYVAYYGQFSQLLVV